MRSSLSSKIGDPRRMKPVRIGKDKILIGDPRFPPSQQRFPKTKRKKERHKLAKTTVEVYRLFKIRDFGIVLSNSSDGVIAAIGRSIRENASMMIEPYAREQEKLQKVPEHAR